jgi:hypothetical protein
MKTAYHNQEFRRLCDNLPVEIQHIFWTGRDDRKDGYYFVTLSDIGGEILGSITYFDKGEFEEDLTSAGREYSIEFIQN